MLLDKVGESTILIFSTTKMIVVVPVLVRKLGLTTSNFFARNLTIDKK